MKLNKSYAYAYIYSFYILLLSLYLLPYFINGDQTHYRDFYYNCLISSYSLDDKFYCYQNTLGTAEPVYFVLSNFFYWMGFDKNLFISLFNCLLAFLLVKIVFKYYSSCWHRHFFIILVLTNFYFIVMLFSAERLKFGLLFLILALLVEGNKKSLLYFFMVLTHIQMSIILISIYIMSIFSKSNSLFKKTLTILGCFIFFGIIFYFIGGHIKLKYDAYSTMNSSNGFLGALKTSIFLLLASVSIKKILPLIIGSPIVFLAYFLGSDRIAVLSFIVYVGVVIYYKNKMDFILVIVMLYFTFKSIDFISNIILYGNGFNFN